MLLMVYDEFIIALLIVLFSVDNGYMEFRCASAYAEFGIYDSDKEEFI